MKRYLSKFLIIFFLLGINIPFSSFILNNLKNTSLKYSALCKFNDSSKSQEKTSKKYCFFCILKNAPSNDDILSTSCINMADSFIGYIVFSDHFNFFGSSKNTFQKIRSPPFLS